jgi:cytochrome P450
MTEALEKLNNDDQARSEPSTFLQHMFYSKEKYNLTDKDIMSIMGEIFQAGIDTV